MRRQSRGRDVGREKFDISVTDGDTEVEFRKRVLEKKRTLCEEGLEGSRLG